MEKSKITSNGLLYRSLTLEEREKLTYYRQLKLRSKPKSHPYVCLISYFKSTLPQLF